MHSLTTTIARIDHGAKSERQKFLIASDFHGGLKKLTDHLMVVPTFGRIRLVERSDMLFRNHQEMHFGLRPDVADTDEAIVLVDAG